MHIIRVDDVPKKLSDSPLFTGGPVSLQPLVTDKMGTQFSLNMVNFSAGARNRFHVHTSDQILIVTAGKGVVATGEKKQSVTVGDIIHIPAGEKHWHGATKDSALSHIALTTWGSKTTQVED